MTPLPLTPQVQDVARRVIWFQPPQHAIADPVRFAAYALTYGTHEDMKVLRRHWSDDDLREALAKAPPGIIDPRSWTYWHLKLGQHPPPPMPRRKLDHAASAMNK